jgi:hypothetical protein
LLKKSKLNPKEEIHIKRGNKLLFFDFFENLWYNIYTIKKKGKDVYAN